MSAIGKDRLTLEEYIEFDRSSEERWEYFNGAVVSISGGSLAHNRIARNLTTILTNGLAGGDCEVLPADMRIKVPKAPPYRYADIVVVCGRPSIESVHGLDVLVNPRVIVEILSDSTEAYDRGTKFLSYQSIDGFEEYLLVAQDKPYVTHYVRQSDCNWLRTDIEGFDRAITLAAISCTAPLSAVYSLVEFP